mgnify:CR=1 FL=1
MSVLSKWKLDSTILSSFYFDYSYHLSLGELMLTSTNYNQLLFKWKRKTGQLVIFSLLPCPVFSGSKNRIETWIYGKNNLNTGHCTIIPNSLLCPVFRSLSGFSFFRDARKKRCSRLKTLVVFY